jgi:hypothetical protein
MECMIQTRQVANRTIHTTQLPINMLRINQRKLEDAVIGLWEDFS